MKAIHDSPHLYCSLGPNKHQSAVTCLHFNKKFVITSSDDGTVKLWDVKSGEYIRDEGLYKVVNFAGM